MKNEVISSIGQSIAELLKNFLNWDLLFKIVLAENQISPKEFQPISLCITPSLIDEFFLSSNQIEFADFPA